MDEHRHKVFVTLVFFVVIYQVEKNKNSLHSQTSTKAEQKERKMKGWNEEKNRRYCIRVLI